MISLQFGKEILIDQKFQSLKFNDNELKNINLVNEYMQIAYSPQQCTGANSVKHLCADENKFIAPTTFPNVKNMLEYAEEHKKIMECLDDLHIVTYDVIFAKDNWVALRYTAEGTHKGKAYKNIQPSGKHAKWTAATFFEVEPVSCKLKTFYKDWDKAAMWRQLGWPEKEVTCVLEAI